MLVGIRINYFDEIALGIHMQRGIDENDQEFHQTTLGFIFFSIEIFNYNND